MYIFIDIIVPIAALSALGLATFCAIRIRQMERRLNNADANFAFIKNMLIEIDSKLTNSDTEDTK